MNTSTIKRLSYFCLGIFVIISASTPAISAQSLPASDQNSIYGDSVWYKAGVGSGSCTDSGPVTGGKNLDYAGNPILTQGELQALSQNEPIYQQAAQQAGIPWQVLASVHHQETDFSLVAPPNGDGQYQIVSKNYPSSGTISQQEFLKESIDAANFIKKDGAGLTANPTVATVKKAFYYYNGTGGSLYPRQAGYLGYDPKTQGYEGSPYVMNRADAQRDPTLPAVANSGKWLQFGTGPGGSIGPATLVYGAYVVYASLAGITLGGDCSTGSVDCSPSNTSAQSSASPNSSSDQVRQAVVCVAEHELSLWKSGQMKAGTDFEKYSEGRDELWCADFVSWVYNQAGYPLGPAGSPTSNWNISYVGSLLVPPQSSTKFVYHSSSGYRPRPGDMAIHSSSDNPYYHVNLVDSVSPGKIVLLGGDQHGSGGPEGNVVNTYTIFSPSDDSIIGYVGLN